MKARILIPIIVVVGIYTYIARQAKKAYNKAHTKESVLSMAETIALLRYMQWVKSRGRRKPDNPEVNISEIKYTIN